MILAIVLHGQIPAENYLYFWFTSCITARLSIRIAKSRLGYGAIEFLVKEDFREKEKMHFHHTSESYTT
jgi:hypothetical protein